LHAHSRIPEQLTVGFFSCLQILIGFKSNFTALFQVVKNKPIVVLNGLFAQNNRIFKIILQKNSSYQ
jgi:hypothetical protein